jgi:phosphohistidine phosphatase
MQLVFLRHGIAIDREDPECPADAERPLTRKGEKRTRAAAEGLRALGVAPETILTSSYLRARQTAAIAASALGVAPERIHVVAAMTPDAAPGPLFAALTRHAGSATVLVAGHAPHLDLALRFALDREDVPLWSLKKAGAACVELERPGRPGGRLLWLLEPSTLRAIAHVAGPDESD